MGKDKQMLEQIIEKFTYHDYCGDNWFSCPLAPEGCSDDRNPKDKCTCGTEGQRINLASAIKDFIRGELNRLPQYGIYTEGKNKEAYSVESVRQALLGEANGE